MGEVFVVSKIKNTVLWTYVISDLNDEEVIRSFYEKELQKTSQEKFRNKKYLKEKVINCMSNGKGMIIYLIVGSIKKPCIKMSQYFPKPFKSFGGNINIKVDLSNYATKTNLKNVTRLDTSGFALKTNLESLKTEVGLNFDKLEPVPVDLSKLM